MMEEKTFQPPHNDPDDPLVHAVLAESEFAAQTKAALLQDEGIDAYVFAGAQSWTGGLPLGLSTDGVPVWVRKSNLEQAKNILTQRIADSVDLDWDEVDVGEMEPADTGNSAGESGLLQLVVKFGWLIGVVIVLLGVYTFLNMLL